MRMFFLRVEYLKESVPVHVFSRLLNSHTCMYVCICACMYACTSVCLYVHARTHARTHAHTYKEHTRKSI